MKSYIIETDDKDIWTYEAEIKEKIINIILLKPHGGKTYSLEDSQDYWEWFKEEFALTEKEEVDICYIYSKSGKEKFDEFGKYIPKFSYPVQTKWRVSVIIKFFKEYRFEHISDIEFKKTPTRFENKGGKNFIIHEFEPFKLVDDFNSMEEGAEKDVQAEKDPSQELVQPKTSGRIKVYSPPVKTIKPSNGEITTDKIAAVEQEKNTTQSMLVPSAIDKNISTEKITAEDLQRYMQNETKGQCDTVKFRT